MDMCNHTFVQIHRMYSTMSEPYLNYGPWLWCINLSSSVVKKKKSAILESDINWRVECVAVRGAWEIYLPLSFAVKPKAPLK